MDAAQLDVEGGEVPALAVGPPEPTVPKPRRKKPAPPPARPEPAPGQLDLDGPLGVDALFPTPLT